MEAIMRVMVLIMFLIVIVYGVIFYSLNYGIYVDTIFTGWGKYENVSVFWIAFFAFILGVLWALIVYIIQESRLRIRISKLKSKLKKLNIELDNLRTMPLSDIGLEDKND